MLLLSAGRILPSFHPWPRIGRCLAKVWRLRPCESSWIGYYALWVKTHQNYPWPQKQFLEGQNDFQKVPIGVDPQKGSLKYRQSSDLAALVWHIPFFPLARSKSIVQLLKATAADFEAHFSRVQRLESTELFRNVRMGTYIGLGLGFLPMDALVKLENDIAWCLTYIFRLFWLAKQWQNMQQLLGLWGCFHDISHQEFVFAGP